MAIGIGDVTSGLLLAVIAVLAWRRRRNVGGKRWAFRVVPFGLFVCFFFAHGRTMELVTLGLTFVAYAIFAYCGGWRLAEPKKCLFRTVLYCLEDGYGWHGLEDHRRFLRVNVEKETVELKSDAGWFSIPEKGLVRGWGGCPGDLKNFVFDMYPGGDLNNENGWTVTVTGTPVGKSMDGMALIGEIDTRGRFSCVR